MKDLGDTHTIVEDSTVANPAAVVVSLPCPRTFSRGASGDDVWAVQSALREWGKEKRPSKEANVRRYAPTGTVAFPTVSQIKHFQDLHNVPQSGVVGPRTWNLLTEFMKGNAIGKAQAAYKKYHPDTTRDKIARAALDGYANRSQIRYVQVRPMVWHHSHPQHAEGLYAEDCSSFATWCYWVAGAPDPCGMDFSGYGNTDSMLSHCHRVAAPKVGDLALYYSPGHVAVVVKVDPFGIWVVSNGHYPMAYEKYNYGHPFVGFYSAIND